MLSSKEQDKNITHFNDIFIFNKLPLKSSNVPSIVPTYVYIIGKMYSHSTAAKYSFKAFDFDLFFPETKSLYHSSMNSENCFTNMLKWTPNFFKKIRTTLSSSVIKSNTYFKLNNKTENEGEIESITKTYLELHFLVEKKDVNTFRMLLETVSQIDPYSFIINKCIALSQEKESSLEEKSNKILNKENEIKRINTETQEIEANFNKIRREYMIKFYLLLKEKEVKKKELEKEVAKTNSNNK